MLGNAKTSGVPVFQLYGEADAEEALSTLHVEALAMRSGLHNWEIRPHRHIGLHQIFLVQQGAGEVLLDDESHSFTGPCLITIPPLLVHGFRYAPQSQGHVVTVAEDLVSQLAGMFGVELAGLLDTPAIHAVHEGEARLAGAFEALSAEFHEQAPWRSSALSARLGLVLIEVARTGATQAAAADARGHAALMRSFRALVQQHASERWSVLDYADALAVTKARLNAVCQRLTGRSPLQLVHDRLLAEAKRNLIHTSMSVGEISYLLGFREPAYFCRFFTQKAGCPPSAFRKRWDEHRAA